MATRHATQIGKYFSQASSLIVGSMLTIAVSNLGWSVEPMFWTTKRPSDALKFADFPDLIPEVLPSRQVFLVVHPTKSFDKFDKLFMASSEVADKLIVAEIGLATSDFLNAQDVPPFNRIQAMRENAIRDAKVIGLSMAFCDFSQELLADGEHWQHTIKVLEAGGSALTKRQLETIALRCTNLVAIDVSDTNISVSDLLAVSGISHRIRAASLGGIVGTPDEFCRLLSNWPRIEKLYLHGTCVDDVVCESLSNLPRLRTLDISETHITPASIKRILSIRSLEELHICKLNFPIEASVFYNALPHLRKLRTDDPNQIAIGALPE